MKAATWSSDIRGALRLAKRVGLACPAAVCSAFAVVVDLGPRLRRAGNGPASGAGDPGTAASSMGRLVLAGMRRSCFWPSRRARVGRTAQPPRGIGRFARVAYAPTMDRSIHAAETPPYFNAVITPHRSLSARGVRWLLLAMAGLAGLVAIRFWLLGAWPVIAFTVVEVLLAGLLLWINHRAGRAVELVMLFEDRARIVRRSPGGRQTETALPAAWLSVMLEDEPDRVTRLWLCHRNRREEIGAALGEAEKRELADALRAALVTQRSPIFDNPQLRSQPTA
jgi:uncharacterized membrane protein